MFATASYGGGWSPLKCPQPPQVRPSCRSRRPDSSLNNTHHYVYAGGCGYRSIAQIGSSHTALFCSSTTCPPVRPAARMSEAESENCSHCASARDNTHDTHTHTQCETWSQFGTGFVRPRTAVTRPAPPASSR